MGYLLDTHVSFMDDRLLIATALYENLAIISVDEKFELYKDEVKIVW